MKDTKRYVTFINEDVVNKGDIIKGNTIVYPTIPDSLRCCKIEDKKQIAEISIMGDYKEVTDDEYGRIVANEIKVDNILEYYEIVNEVLNGNKNFKHLIKFLSSFELTKEDQEKFADLGYHTWLAVECYQKNNKNIYTDAVIEEDKVRNIYDQYCKQKNK